MLEPIHDTPGRNDPCHCGSGKKYKKCCIHAVNSVAPFAEAPDTLPTILDDMPHASEEVLVHTTTGEPFTPARLYYKVHDRQKLRQAMLALKCIDTTDEDENALILSYWYEAKKVKLTYRYDQVPEELFPIHLATCRLRGDNEMLVDVRSFARASQMVLFFDQYISRKIAEVTHIAVYNRVVKRPRKEIAEDSPLSWDFDVLFSPDTMQIADPFKHLEDDPLDDDEALQDKELEELNKPLPEATKLQVHFYENGIRELKFFLQMRLLIARLSSVGDKPASMGEIIHALMAPSEMDAEEDVLERAE